MATVSAACLPGCHAVCLLLLCVWNVFVKGE